MQERLIDLFLNVRAYKTRLQRDKARMVYAVLYTIILAFTVYAIFAPDWYTTEPYDYATYVPLIQALPYRPTIIIFLIVPYVLTIAGSWLTRAGRLQAAQVMASLFVYLTTVFPVIVLETVSFADQIFLINIILFVLVASLLNGERAVWISAVIALVTYVADPGESAQEGSFFTFLMQLGSSLFVAYYFLRLAVSTRADTEEVAGAERVKLAEITQTVTRIGSERVSFEEALNRIIRILQENYPQFYHVQIFAIDDSGVQARLVASTGDVGRVLLGRNHSLAVGSLSVIGQTTFRGEPVIAYAGQAGTNYKPNDLLSQTKTEVAFPMRIGNQVIGALDMQSYDDLTFTSNDVATFQALADSIALVMDNVRQFENARTRVEENQLLAEQARNALAEVQRLNKRLIGRAWSDYLRDQRETLSVQVDIESGSVTQDAEWTPTLQRAIQQNSIVRDGNIVSVPLMVRGQVIGAMEFELDESGELAADDLEMLREVSERFGLAAENARLVEQSQRTAQREALINVISSRLQTTNNVESTLAEAARSLSEVLNAERVVVRLGKPSVVTTPLNVASGD
jgi:GAF domain-containing protein